MSAATAASAAPGPKRARSSAIPFIPVGDSPPPPDADWKAATPLVDPNGPQTPPDCSLKVIREWVRVQCKDTDVPTHLTKYGRPGTDYFEDVLNGLLTIKMKKGELWSTLINLRDKRIVHFLMVWPSSEDQPLVLSFGLAPQGVTAFDVKKPEPPPSFPKAPGDRPHSADWYISTPINTYSGSREVPTCALETIQGWLRLRCRKGRHGAPTFQAISMGTIQKDYFIQRDGDSFELVVPLKKGDRLTARIVWENPEDGVASFRAGWPKDKDQPDELAVSQDDLPNLGGPSTF